MLRASSVIAPPSAEPSKRYWEPILEVMMMTVLRKSMVRPCESVIRPSSSTCSKVLKMSGWAFSTSSNSTTE
ncbi:hypothetical protein D9M72_595120 [compost metagenome]